MTHVSVEFLSLSGVTEDTTSIHTRGRLRGSSFLYMECYLIQSDTGVRKVILSLSTPLKQRGNGVIAILIF